MPANFQTMLEPLSKSASVKSVYGEPFAANGRTIIPVARVAYGFGGGSGRKHDAANPNEGEGGGGGVYAAPVGLIEITDTETRFIGLNDRRKLAAAALAGFTLGAFLFWSRR